LATRLWEIPELKRRYNEIYQRLATEVVDPEKVIERMNVLRGLVRPWVERDTQKLCTMEQFEDAMSKDIQAATGGQGGPGGPQPPPQLPPQLPPDFQPPGGMGAQSIPGLEGFVRARIEWIRAQLANP